MIVKVISKKDTRGYKEVEIDISKIEYLSDTKKLRNIAVEGNSYRLTAKSYTELKKKTA